MESTFQSRSLYYVFLTLLALFGLSLALSKSASNVLIALVYLFALYQILWHRDSRRVLLSHLRQPLGLALALYIGVALIGVFYSNNVSDGFGIVNKMVGMALIYFMFSTILDAFGEERQVSATRTLLMAFVAGVIVLDIIADLTYLGIIGDRKFSLPVYPLHVHHIWFANLNAVSFYTSIVLLLFPDAATGIYVRAKNYVLLSLLPLSLFAMLFSLSRTAWFGFAVTAVILSYFLIGNKKRYLLMLGILAVVAILVYASNGIVHNRVDLIFSETAAFFSGKAQTNIGERFLMWKASLKMFLSNPLFGVGTGDYVRTMHSYIQSGAMPAFLSDFNQPHNMFLFALATNGLIGLGTLLFLFYSVISYCLPLIHGQGRERVFGLIGLAVAVHYVAGGMTDSFLNIQMLRYTFAFGTGICIRTALNARIVPRKRSNSL